MTEIAQMLECLKRIEDLLARIEQLLTRLLDHQPNPEDHP
jgi:hypothetical protein